MCIHVWLFRNDLVAELRVEIVGPQPRNDWNASRAVASGGKGLQEGEWKEHYRKRNTLKDVVQFRYWEEGL